MTGTHHVTPETVIMAVRYGLTTPGMTPRTAALLVEQFAPRFDDKDRTIVHRDLTAWLRDRHAGTGPGPADEDTNMVRRAVTSVTRAATGPDVTLRTSGTGPAPLPWERARRAASVQEADRTMRAVNALEGEPCCCDVGSDVVLMAVRYGLPRLSYAHVDALRLAEREHPTMGDEDRDELATILTGWLQDVAARPGRQPVSRVRDVERVLAKMVEQPG